ncbi:MAG: lipid II flippase MurJ [Desulfobacterales bacterium]
MEFGFKSIKRKILGAATIVGFFTILSQVGGFAKELTVAAWFGTGDAVDAFIIALLVPSFIVNILAGSISASFLPTFIRVYRNRGVAGAQKVITGVISGFLLFGLVLSAILILFAPLYLPALCSGFSPEKLRLTRMILYALAPIILLKGLSTICAGVLNALDNFALAAILPILGPLSAIFFILTGGASLGIYALVIGTILGFGLEAVLISGAIIKRKFSLRPRLIDFDPDLRIVLGQFLPMVAGSILMGSTDLVDKGMAATLSPGSVAALNYGNKIIAAVLTLATTAIGTAVLPYFTRMVSEKDWKNIRSILKSYLSLIFAVGILTAIVIYLFSDSIVNIILQRGSFTAEDTTVVSAVQAYFAFQIPFYIGGIVVVRLISALRANHILMWGAAINLVVNIGFNILFIHYLGLKGIALSTSFVYLISFLFLVYFANRIIIQKERM